MNDKVRKEFEADIKRIIHSMNLAMVIEKEDFSTVCERAVEAIVKVHDKAVEKELNQISRFYATRRE